jgi:hypothetical protein
MTISCFCDCPCRDCMQTSITDDNGLPTLCHECEGAGCEAGRDCAAVSWDDAPTVVLDADETMADLVYGRAN